MLSKSPHIILIMTDQQRLIPSLSGVTIMPLPLIRIAWCEKGFRADRLIAPARLVLPHGRRYLRACILILLAPILFNIGAINVPGCKIWPIMATVVSISAKCTLALAIYRVAFTNESSSKIRPTKRKPAVAFCWSDFRR